MILRSLAMLTVGVAPVLYWRRRHSSTSKAWFALGAAAWLAGVSLKVAWAIPMNPVVHGLLDRHLSPTLARPAFDAYVGMLTGVFEVALVFAAAHGIRRLRETSTNDAVAFGLAFGGIEASILAFVGLAGLAHPESFSASTIFMGPLERVSATLVHVVCCVLVLSPAFRARPWRAFALAFTFKSMVDAAAAFALLDVDVFASTSRLVVFEAVLAMIATGAMFAVSQMAAARPEAT